MSDVLIMEKVVKSFGQGHTEVTALKNVDFHVAAGEFVSIIGPSGSGKSTFLTIAGGLQTPTKGKIIINDSDFGQMNERERSKARFKEIGFILQSSKLIPCLKVREQFQLVEKIEKEKNAAKIEGLLKSL
ncbi:MAG: ATP-binding cassette domain-containing protein, partial [Enterococcus sp.]